MRINNNLLGFLFILVAVGCTKMYYGPWDQHPIPTISVKESFNIFNTYIEESNDDIDYYVLEPIILDNYFVYPSSILSYPSAAYMGGIWVNIHSGQVGTYEEIKQVDNTLE